MRTHAGPWYEVSVQNKGFVFERCSPTLDSLIEGSLCAGISYGSSLLCGMHQQEEFLQPRLSMGALTSAEAGSCLNQTKIRILIIYSAGLSGAYSVPNTIVAKREIFRAPSRQSVAPRNLHVDFGDCVKEFFSILSFDHTIILAGG